MRGGEGAVAHENLTSSRNGPATIANFREILNAGGVDPPFRINT